MKNASFNHYQLVFDKMGDENRKEGGRCPRPSIAETPPRYLVDQRRQGAQGYNRAPFCRYPMIVFSVADGRMTASVLAASPWKYPPKSTAGPCAAASSLRMLASPFAKEVAMGAK